jgi:hypothetical protein
LPCFVVRAPGDERTLVPEIEAAVRATDPTIVTDPPNRSSPHTV